jgi:hypothetical protein
MSKAAELANLIGNINAGGGGVNRNVIINGAMNVAQRQVSATGLGASSTSSTTNTRYKCCDRWGFETNADDGRFTMSQDASVPTGKGFANSLKFACTTTDTSIGAGELLIIQQRIEGQNLQAFAKGTSEAKPFALSFYAKANASKTYVAELYDIDNNRHVGKTFTVGTDWAKHEITFPADTTGAFGDDTGRSLDFNIWLHGGATYTGGTLGTTWQAEDADDRAAGIGSFYSSTDNTFFLTGVQLEVGQNPTEFEHEPFERTLAKCQRYYEHCYDTVGTTFPADDVAFGSGMTLYNGNCWANDNIRCQIHFLVRKRALPTVTAYSVSGLANGSTANRWDWYDGGWGETTGATSFSEVTDTGIHANIVDADASNTNAYMVAGGWDADAEL